MCCTYFVGFKQSDGVIVCSRDFRAEIDEHRSSMVGAFDNYSSFDAKRKPSKVIFAFCTRILSIWVSISCLLALWATLNRPMCSMCYIETKRHHIGFPLALTFLVYLAPFPSLVKKSRFFNRMKFRSIGVHDFWSANDSPTLVYLQLPLTFHV